MLCKKCKTAVSDIDTVCGYCGSDMTHKRDRIVLLIVFFSIVTFLVTYLIYAGNQTGQPENLTPGAAAPEPNPDIAPPTSTPEPVKTEEPTPTSSPDMEKTQGQVMAMLNEVLLAVNQFYEDYSPSVAYISKNGYLYDLPGKAYVKIHEVAELMGLGPEYSERNILFFYMKPSDLKGISGFSVNDDSGLVIFAAYETKDGYYMTASLQSNSGLISRTELQRILEKYKSEHGPIIRYPADSEDFSSIVSEIGAYNNFNSGYDVRYMAGDDKYAVAVVSPVGSPEVIEEYVLMDRDGEWKICVSNFEDFERYKVDVNRLLPDLNLSLLPDYDMHNYIYRMRNNFAEVINAMKSSGMISDRDGVASFASGTAEFVYLEFQSNVKFIGHLNADNVWVMFAISDYHEGEAVLRSITKNPPLFIMKQY